MFGSTRDINKHIKGKNRFLNAYCWVFYGCCFPSPFCLTVGIVFNEENYMKWFIKLFIPKPKALANMTAEAIAKVINESNKTDIIKQYNGYAVKLTELQTFIVKLLEDGKIDDSEKAKIAKMLTPIATKIMEAI